MNSRTLMLPLAATAVTLAAAAGWMATQSVHGGGTTGHAAPTEAHGTALAGAGSASIKASAGADWRFAWNSIETNDYRAYIANLRRIKCPEPTIRDIIIAEIGKYFAPREAPFKETTAAVAPKGETAAQKRARLKQDYERRRQLRGIELEKAAVIKQLLDYDLPLEPLHGWHTRNYERFEAAINSLPPEKREKVRAIQEAYWELSDALNDERADKLKGAKNAEYVAQYKANNEKRLAALAQALSPAELENYEMRCSSVAGKLATSLADFKPTDEEFRAIWRGRHEIDEPFGGMMTAGSTDNYKPDPQKEADFQASVKAQLGEDRYAAYQRTTDGNYQSLGRLRDRFGLSQDTIDQAYAIFQQNPQIMQPPNPKVEIVDGRQVQTAAPEPPKEALAKLRALLGSDPFTVALANSPWAGLSQP